MPVLPTATLPPPTATLVPPTLTSQPSATPLQPLSGSGGGVIAFVSTRSGDHQIYVMNADGSDRRRLTYRGDSDGIPAWSPDGARIAFHAHYGLEVWAIEVIDADGNNRQRLTHENARDAAPRWSPDGMHITFGSDRDGNFEIYIMNADGGDLRQLTDDGAEAEAPDWSPDGARIAFASNLDGDFEIYSMDVDGGNRRQLTDDDSDDWWPAWSPDGSQIAFMSDRDGDWEIYIMDADGSNLRQLTDNDAKDSDPAWSPDGTQIVFNSSRDGDEEIYVMNADGSDLRQLTNNDAAYDWGADWRPEPATGPTAGGSSPALGDTWIRPVDDMVMVYVPAGEFQMGSDDAEVDAALEMCKSYYSSSCVREWFEVEQPVHTVRLDGFWIDRTEVTNAMYRRCVEAGVCKPPLGNGSDTRTTYYGDPVYDSYPVINVDWHRAQTYCEWAGGRLPTEAEWEYAARGPEGWRYPWGDEYDGTRLNSCDITCEYAWEDRDFDDGYADTAPVGSYPGGASRCGALDLVGNVWEWTGDRFGEYSPETQVNPTGPASGTEYAVRGDAADGTRSVSRGAARHGMSASRTYVYTGFRCVYVGSLP